MNRTVLSLVSIVLSLWFSLELCAQTNSVPATWTNTFTVTPSRKMRPADRDAYVRAGGATNATDTAIYTWQHYAIHQTNGITLVPSGVVISKIHNPLWDWAEWLVSLAYVAGQKPPFQNDAFAGTLTDWATNAVAAQAACFNPSNEVTSALLAAGQLQIKINNIQAATTQAVETWATLRALGYDLNHLPPVSLEHTNGLIYERLP